MSDETAPHSVTGGWLGTYHYGDRAAKPCRFEATLKSGDAGRFSGTILDDGRLGEAAVEKGVQTARRVRFTKVYLHADSALVAPVHYEGTLSEDGKRMRGTWNITARDRRSGRRRVTAYGEWEARRLWGEEAADEATPEQETAGRVRELVGAPF